jgi:hypothetical protein
MTTTITQSITRSLIGTAVLSAAALLGNQFVEGWNWGPSDFVVMGAMVFIAGFIFSLILQSGSRYRIVAAITLVVLFAWLWVELAVGLFTNWGS